MNQSVSILPPELLGQKLSQAHYERINFHFMAQEFWPSARHKRRAYFAKWAVRSEQRHEQRSWRHCHNSTPLDAHQFPLGFPKEAFRNIQLYVCAVKSLCAVVIAQQYQAACSPFPGSLKPIKVWENSGVLLAFWRNSSKLPALAHCDCWIE